MYSTTDLNNSSLIGSALAGIPAEAQVLQLGGQVLPDNVTAASYGVCEGSLLVLTGRLRGGAPTITVTVRPRVQKDKWSLYWKVPLFWKQDLSAPVSEIFHLCCLTP